MSEDPYSVLARLAKPFEPHEIKWRQDGEPFRSNGRDLARFVPFLDAHTVRARLDEEAFGLWNFRLEVLPHIEQVNRQTGEDLAPLQAFRGILEIAGIVREDTGQGKDYKTAASDAFKRAAQRFAIGAELHTLPRLSLEVKREGKYWRPAEDPSRHYQAGVPASAKPAPREAPKREPERKSGSAQLKRTQGGADLERDQKRAEEAKRNPADPAQLKRLEALAQHPRTDEDVREQVMHAIETTGLSKKTAALWIDTLEAAIQPGRQRAQAPAPAREAEQLAFDGRARANPNHD